MGMGGRNGDEAGRKVEGEGRGREIEEGEIGKRKEGREERRKGFFLRDEKGERNR